MTRVKNLLILMSDGTPRTKADVAEAMGLSLREAHCTLRTAMKGSNMKSHVPQVFYTITESGKTEAVRQPVKKKTLERKARERAERIRRAAEEVERKKAEAERRSQAGSITFRAKSGQIANSVFALGGGL